MKPVKKINNLKLRASFGITGNNSIPNYATINTLNTTLYPFGTTVSTGLANTSSTLANRSLTWEQVDEYNAGFDLSVFKNAININLDAYYSITRSLLFERPVQSFTGYTTSWSNIGKVRNKGIELNIETYNFNRKEFTWITQFNISCNRNRLLALGGESEIINTGYSKEMYINRVGEKAIQFYGYKTDGVWMTAEQLANEPKFATNIDRLGGLKCVDVYPDGVLNDKDLTVIGDPYPDFIWGVTNTFSFKGFDCSFLFQGSQGGELVNADATYKDIQLRNLKYNTANRWASEEHPGDGKTPTTNGIAWICTDYDVEDASYISLRNVTLGYTFDKSALRKMHLSKLRLYVSGNNLWFLTANSFRGINVEYRNTSSPYNSPLIGGYQRGCFPVVSTITFGLDINF